MTQLYILGGSSVALVVAVYVWRFLTQLRLLDRLFPTVMNNLCGYRTYEQQRKIQCHKSVNHDRTAPNWCVVGQCEAWGWANGGPGSWRRILTKQRGRCCDTQIDKNVPR